MMKKVFAVLGAGMQGTAAAYDLCRFGDPGRVLIADYNLEQAQVSATRVNELIGLNLCEPTQVDALDENHLGEFLESIDIVLSCVPYWMHPRIAKVAIRSRTHMCDLGGNTEVTHQTLGLDELAKDAGVTLIPDTGLAPGLVNSIGKWLIEQMDATESVKLLCGVLPQNPIPPLNYKLTFNIEGLLTEYDYQAVVLRNGKILSVDTLDEIEEIDIAGLGSMEAFTTSGGTSTAPYTFQKNLENYEYKTIRFPGHCEKMRLFRDAGLWSETPIEVKGATVRPRDLFCAVFGPRLAAIRDLDQCIIRGVGVGVKSGHRVQIQVDLHDLQEHEASFTSMERTTGFSISIHAIALAKGMVPPGAIRYENALTGKYVLGEIEKRGVRWRQSEIRLPEP